MIRLHQLKHAALIASLAFQAGCSDSDTDIDQVSSTSSDLVALPEIKSYLNNKCLDIQGANNSNGAHVIMWDCWGGANQHWYWSSEEIRSSLNNKCLDVEGANGSSGVHVIMWDCWGGANQKWYWDGSQIKSRLNNKCLDVQGGNNSSGAHVIMWDCWGGANQKWY